MSPFKPLVAVALCAAMNVASATPTIAGCPVFPSNNIWNARVDALPVHSRSDAWVANVSSTGSGATRSFHMDFGAGLYPPAPDPTAAPIGIPYVVTDGSQPKVPVTFTYWDESDPGPYPIPPNAPIEGVGPANAAGDRHVLVIDSTNCLLYETYYSFPQNGGASWTADSGAVFDLHSNVLRPAGWTSADAAGLPIFPGLARYDEVAAGSIDHALRFTAQRTQSAYVWPARHKASTITDANVAPMGARFRLKAAVDISRFSPQARVIAQAMKTYGIILADNGSPWFVTGIPDSRWSNSALQELTALTGGNFEAVDESSLLVSVDSGEAAGAAPLPPGLADSATSLATSANPSPLGYPLTFTANVTSAAGTPSGTVDFRADSAAIAGCASLALANGVAACVTSALSAGSHAIVAAYSGSTSVATSSSSALSQSITASSATVTLTVAKSGNGTGNVSSADGAIDCGSLCAATVASGTAVTLVATPSSTSNFTGWSGGGCGSNATCTVTVTAATSVTAAFKRKTGRK